MSIYTEYIFPWALDKFMSQPEFHSLRKETLRNISGKILEIGFGTGLNLAHYPNSVKKITAIDKNRGMSRLANKRINNSVITVKHFTISADKLPFKSNYFDTVVSTWTLCSIPNVHQALSEVYRVLKKGGKFFFLEHGLSKDYNVQRIQVFLNPIQKVFGDGCNVTRNIRSIVKMHNFKSVHCKEFYKPNSFKYIGYLYQGIALK